MIRRIIRNLLRRNVRQLILLWDAAEHDERPYSCMLLYSTGDPFAVKLLVPSHDTPDVAEIVFARGLLIEGIDQSAGDGAVRVAPHIVDRDYSTLTLPLTPDGKEFHTGRAPLQKFVDDTCALVPSGRERPRVNAKLDRWLAGVAAR